MRVIVIVCVIAKKWVPLISIVLFTFSDAKHQREKLLMVNATLTVNRPLPEMDLEMFLLEVVKTTGVCTSLSFKYFQNVHTRVGAQYVEMPITTTGVVKLEINRRVSSSSWEEVAVVVRAV